MYPKSPQFEIISNKYAKRDHKYTSKSGAVTVNPTYRGTENI